jgi:hypothetical protein
MRFLIGCILFFSVSLSSAYKLKAERITGIQYGATKLSPSLNRADISAKLLKNVFMEEQSSSNIERTTPHAHVFTFCSLANEPSPRIAFITYPLNHPIEGNNSHSYQFIFNCLYPKHTFW